MALTTTGDYQLAINKILYAIDKNFGYGFPYDELTRDGGISDADVATLRDAYQTYKTTREARPSLTPAHPDKTIHTTNQLGRSNPGGTSPQEDTVIHSHVATGVGK